MREIQKASRTEERLAMPRITTVIHAGISSRFIQDLPATIKSPIITPQKIQERPMRPSGWYSSSPCTALVYELKCYINDTAEYS